MGSLGMQELILIPSHCLGCFQCWKTPSDWENRGKTIRNFKNATEREKIDVTPKKSDKNPEESKQGRVQAYWPDLLFVLAIAVVVFGPKKLPELAKIH